METRERALYESLPTAQTFGELPAEAAWLQHLWLEITEKCNLECVHCYADSSPAHPLWGAMTEVDWFRVLDQAADAGCSSIQFIGGEPTLHPSLDKLLERARSLGVKNVEVYTNGTTLTKKRATLYCDLGVNIALSFYSSKASVHDAIAQRSGSFARTLRGIRVALEQSLPIRVGIIQIEQTDEEIEAAKAFLYASFGIDNVSVDQARRVGRLDTLSVLGKTDFSQLCGMCYQGRLCVTASGEVHPCIMARQEPLGNVRTQSLADIFVGRRRRNFVAEQVAYIQERDALLMAQPCEPNSGNCSPAQTSCGPAKPVTSRLAAQV